MPQDRTPQFEERGLIFCCASSFFGKISLILLRCACNVLQKCFVSVIQYLTPFCSGRISFSMTFSSSAIICDRAFGFFSGSAVDSL